MKPERINIRISVEDLSELRAASQMSSMSLSSFLVKAGLEKAQEVASQQGILKLTATEYLALERMLAEPVTENKRLSELLKLSAPLQQI